MAVTLATLLSIAATVVALAVVGPVMEAAKVLTILVAQVMS